MTTLTISTYLHVSSEQVLNSGDMATITTAGTLDYYGSIAAIEGMQANTVTNSGSVMSGFGTGVLLDDGGMVTNDANALIHGDKYGVVVSGAAGTVVNLGSIDASSTIMSSFVGVDLGAGGTVTNTGSAAGITGRLDAVLIGGAAGYVTNEGTIAGNFAGISLASGGTVTNSGSAAVISAANGAGVNGYGGFVSVSNDGTVMGGSDGVLLNQGGAVSNNATGSTITGSAYGVRMFSAAGTVTNNGTISGGYNSGIYLGGGGIVTNQGASALIASASGDGIRANYLARIINNGGVIAGHYGGVSLNKGIVQNIGSGATISSTAGDAVHADHRATVVNQGTISSTYSFGVWLPTGSVHNTGHIYGTTAAVYGFENLVATNTGSLTGGIGFEGRSGKSNTLNNDGLVSGTSFGAYGGTFSGGGTIVVNNGLTNHHAVINGGSVAISGGTAIVTNSGTIGGGPGGLGGVVAGAINVTNNAHGLIEGTIAMAALMSASLYNAGGVLGGIDVASVGSLSLTNTSTGELYGVWNYAVVAAGNATVTNSGTIMTEGGSSPTPIAPVAGAIVAGERIFGGTAGVGNAYVTNLAHGLIDGSVNGIAAPGGSVSIYNYGGVVGAKYYGVMSYAGGTVTNASRPAFIYGYAWGVYVPSAGGATTVTNHGTIGGGLGAIHFADASGNLLDLFPGAVENGGVMGGGGSDQIELSQGAGVGTITGLGAQFTGFESIDVAAGAHWKVAGVNTSDALSAMRIEAGAGVMVTGRLSSPGDLTLTSQGTLMTGAAGRIEIGAAKLAHADQVMVDAGHTLTASGTIATGTIRVAGDLVVSGTLALDGGTSGFGTVAITPGGVLSATGTLGVHALTFLPGGGETLVLDAGASAHMNGFAATDTIDLVGIGDVVSKHYTPATHMLDITGTTGSTSIYFAGGNAKADFVATSPVAGEIQITHI